MSPGIIVLIVVLVVVLGALIGLSIYGRKLQKRSEESQAQMKAGAQSVSILVIDKKRMKLTEADLPKIVIDQTPKYLRRSKVPIVKAKIGPKIMNLMCDDKIFDLIPVKKEVKAVMNGIYIMDVKGLRANLDVKPEKQKLFARIKGKITKNNKA
ncbi:hypothetical protein R2R35_12820 [Anaerocolumna sp. AGMB13020]|uniref:hypothetical protein n=1 Tax=Anaerocolumna sp. AGMB13020 TaxID=3081750 RepID=UPI002955D7D9|nr:hypothetical protein [Anaerocolumna sp. AGMB13020]WOO34683.1 hypothetical protein R2R35_12820 [Anaerocolumna sp. AGMB13020]